MKNQMSFQEKNAWRKGGLVHVLDFINIYCELKTSTTEDNQSCWRGKLLMERKSYISWKEFHETEVLCLSCHHTDNLIYLMALTTRSLEELRGQGTSKLHATSSIRP